MRIDIALDTYDDIFSDFDIRNYRYRQISRDFLDELKIRMRQSSPATTITIALLVPPAERTPRHEKFITRRLELFFRERTLTYKQKSRKNLHDTLCFAMLGFLLLFFANFFANKVPSIFSDFLLIPSWYLIWSAFEKVFSQRKLLNERRSYYSALSKATIGFSDRL